MNPAVAHARQANARAGEPGPVDLMLVHPYTFSAADARNYDLLPYPPLGLLMIAAIARGLGYRVAIHDGTFATDPGELDRALERHPPRLAGVGAWSSFRASARAVFARLAARGIPILTGGPDPSLFPDDYLRAGADVVVIGEGEQTLRELLPALLGPPAAGQAAGSVPLRLDPLALKSIPGLAFLASKASDAIVRTPARARLRDLGSLPHAPYDLIPLQPYRDLWRAKFGHTSLPLMTARGCPYRCAWCARPVFGRDYAQRPVDDVVRELRYLVRELGASHIRILDDIFPVRASWIMDWSRALRREGLAFRYDCLSRVDLLTDEVVAALQQSGCDRVFCGVESGSQRILDAMRKGTTVDQSRHARERLRRAGIAFHAYLMFGYPGETHPDVRRTIDLLEELQPEAHSISIAYPMPGTEFYASVRTTLPRERPWRDRDDGRPIFRAPYGNLYYRAARVLARERAVPGAARGTGARLRRGIAEGVMEFARRRDDLLRRRDDLRRSRDDIGRHPEYSEREPD